MAGGASSLDGKLLVAAMDFGTAYSGYAFSFRSDYRLDPLKIEVNHWTGNASQTMSPKAPSSVLLNPDKTFKSFGYTAEEEYSSLVENGQHQEWYFFTKIKMRLLYKEKISRTDIIEDESGKPMLGLTILGMIIRYLKNDLFKKLEQRGTSLRDQDILWVVTVPAIWSDAAKQFTKEATKEAGIKSDDVMLVYEPEAAALYCRFQNMQNMFNAEEKSYLSRKKMLVFDMGGGTTDISVIEIKSEKEIHIVERACGGAFGGVFINNKFILWLEDVFGKDIIKEFKTKHRSDFMLLIENFETKKRLIKPGDDTKLCFQIPHSLKTSSERRWGCSLEEHFIKMDIVGVQVHKRGKIFIMSSFLLNNFFLPIAKDVFEKLRFVLSKHEDIDSVLAVGGLAQSSALVSEIRKYVKDIPVYVPFDSALAVVSGAVLYGHGNNIIKARACPYSYGIQTMRPFIKGDDETKKVVQEGETWCKQCFRTLYKAGDLVKLGDVSSYDLEESFEDENRKHKRFLPIRCVLFISNDKDVRYVTDKGCTEHGTIEIEAPEDGFPVHYECTVELEFAGTEIIARLNDKKGAKTIRLEFMT
ncbi:heat shock 70 kDa protein 12A-like [Crassostrea angulata]|uniref:heat shock 70 kDa protein 12A-like n=1 Tax=Magallana angulata TaxID=2784310 RepID=UPI0022B17BC2|nr:heat shock 70 kDa protein 12A-like [Crassostrea angulata]